MTRSQFNCFPITISIWVFIFATVLLTGCTSKWDVAPKIPKPLASLPIDIKVQLVLSKELRETKWVGMINPMEKAVIPIGEALAIHSENMARALFREVIIESDVATLATSPVDAVLVPRVVSVQRTQPTTIFGQQTSTMIIEWTFTDPKGKVVWVNTINGQGQTKMGLNPKNGAQKQMAIMFEQLFMASYESILSSVEIKQFAVDRW